MIPELLIVALEFYRDPHRFSHLTSPSAPLPAGITDLLAAPGDALSPERIDKTATALVSDADECRAALPFFIKQVLLKNEGDYYRVLGVQRNAQASLIKRHYQYLIRMFHPDREAGNDKWDDLYAPLINEAYSTLRNAQKRREYDAKLESEALKRRGTSSVEAVGAAYMQNKPKPAAEVQPQPQTGLAPARPVSGRIPPHVKKVARWLLASVVVGFALLVALQSGKPTLRIENGAQVRPPPGDTPPVLPAAGKEKAVEGNRGTVLAAPEQESSPSVEEVVRSRVRQAEREVLGVLPRQEVVKEPTRHRRPVESGGAAASAAAQEEAGPRPVTRTDAVVLFETESETETEMAHSPEPALARETVAQGPGQAALGATAMESGSEPPVARPSLIASAEALAALLSSLASSYEAGDIEKFTGLFSEDAATTDATGGQEIYRLYQQFFERQESRTMQVSNFAWGSISDDVMRGAGKLLVTTRPLSGGNVVTAVIEVKLDVEKYPDGLRITGMYYKTRQQ